MGCEGFSVHVRFLESEMISETFRLLCNQTYVLGSGEVDLKLKGDLSVSRKHAKIQVLPASGKDETSVEIELTDIGSKYGTSVEENGDVQKLQTNSPIRLKVGMVVKFGHGSVFKLVSVPVSVTTSSLPVPLKNSLKMNIKLLGGMVLEDWTKECTHLVMSDIKLTVKVVQCLVAGKPIVTPAYFANIVKQAQDDPSMPPPDPLKFLPECGEQSLTNTAVSFTPDPARRSLFEGKVFYFHSDKQYRRLASMVKAAGGKCVAVDSGIGSKLGLAETIVLAVEGIGGTQRVTQSFSLDPRTTEIYAELRRLKKRPIPETDIPLAVAWASTRQYCNPSFQLNKLVVDVQTPKKEAFLQSSDVLAAETQTPTSSRNAAASRQNETQFIPPSRPARPEQNSEMQNLTVPPDVSLADTLPLPDESLDLAPVVTDVPSSSKRRRSPSGEPAAKRLHVQNSNLCEVSNTDYVDATSQRGMKRVVNEIKTEPISLSGDEDLFEACEPSSKRRTVGAEVEQFSPVEEKAQCLPGVESNEELEIEGESRRSEADEVEVLDGFLSKLSVSNKNAIKKEVDENQNETIIIDFAPLMRPQPVRPHIQVITGAPKPTKNYKNFQKQRVKKASQRLSIPLTSQSQSQSYNGAQEREELEEGVAEQPVQLGIGGRSLMPPVKPRGSPFVFGNRKDTQSARATPSQSPCVFSNRKDTQTARSNAVEERAGASPSASTLRATPTPVQKLAPAASKGASLFAFRNDRRKR